MPISISNKNLSNLYKQLESSKGKIDSKTAIQILADVGARSGSSAATVLGQLQKPGLTKDQQIAIAQKGLSAADKKDIETILDKGDVPLDADGKAFLEGVIGRTGGGGNNNGGGGATTGGTVGDSNMKAYLDMKNGVSGFAKAGDTIEAINLSAAPTGRLHIDDTVQIAKAGTDGKFTGGQLSGDQAIQEGDLIRMRARHADGTTSDWITVKADGLGKDTRNAAVALFRVGLTANAAGTVDVANVNTGRQISEPGAQLQFTNARTNEKTVITIGDDGDFPKGTKLNGKAGDVFSVAATDGANNKDFSVSVGKVTVPGGDAGNTDLVPDPAMHKDDINADGTAKYQKTRYTGPLFKDGVDPTDVRQGQLGDCYVPSGFAALAKAQPEALQKAFKDNGDGTYTVTFQEKDWATGKYKAVPIKVDGDLYVRSWGGPYYGTTNSADQNPKTMELWFPLAEKAYAQWKGSYNDIGNGGLSSDIFQAVLGKDGQNDDIPSESADQVWKTVTTSVDKKQPISAGTYGDDKSALYTNTGVYADHSYSVLGYKEKDGEKYVTLRNPWGESEPAGNGANDGIFDMKLSDFTKLYETLMYTNP